jgi:hypothetical protein
MTDEELRAMPDQELKDALNAECARATAGGVHGLTHLAHRITDELERRHPAGSEGT